MTGEDLDVWGAPPSTGGEGGRAADAPEAGDGGDREGRKERRWRRMPVRWLIVIPLVVGLGVWINSYSSLRDERDRALDALAAARGEAGRTSQLLDLQRLESEFRSVDLLMLPDADGFRSTLGVVSVENAEGAPRTWLLLRARGAQPDQRYRLEIKPCDEDVDFPPFTSANTATRDGQLEMTAQNLDIPTDQDEVAVVVRGADGEPLAGVLGPLVLPRRMVLGEAAERLC